MPRFEPFRAIRYASDDLADLTAPPYDVLSEADVLAEREKSPNNFTVIDVVLDGDYAGVTKTLNQWLEDGVLQRDDTDSFTIYRLGFTDELGRERNIVGVLGGLEVVDEGAGGVLPHEHTTPKAKTDRLDLTHATNTNLSPVWGLSLAAGLADALAEPGELLGSFKIDGVSHTVERISDPTRIAAISGLIGNADVLIADGHHRYAISRTYRDQLRASGNPNPNADLTLTFVNELTEDQLSIAAIHRLISNVSFDDLTAMLAQRFDLSSAPAPSAELLAEMVALGRLALLAPNGDVFWLTPKPGAFDHLRDLDSLWLEETLSPLDGVTLTYQHGLDEVVHELGSGKFTAAILIRPTSIEEIRRTALEGLLMPPKSTFFSPKLRSGLVVRPLD